MIDSGFEVQLKALDYTVMGALFKQQFRPFIDRLDHGRAAVVASASESAVRS